MAQSNFIWVLLISLLMLFVVFIFSVGRNDYMYRTNSGQHTLKTYNYQSSVPSENIPIAQARVINEDHIHDDRPIIAFSPTHTIRESVISDVIVGNFENEITRVETKKYNFSVGNRHFGSLGEELCCKIFEEYLEREVLSNTRPHFMKNPKTGRNLELDLYDQYTSVAIEYNGSQHEQYDPKFHKSEQDFIDQQERDKLKLALCKKNGIKLIVVPYTIDCGYKDINGKWHYVSRNRGTREKKLRAYIEPFLDEYCD